MRRRGRDGKKPRGERRQGFLIFGAGGRDRQSLAHGYGKQVTMVAGASDRRSLRGRIPGDFAVPFDPDNALTLLFNAYDLTGVRKDGPLPAFR
jgi:hypothetical protein